MTVDFICSNLGWFLFFLFGVFMFICFLLLSCYFTFFGGVSDVK